jgi:cytochrome P450
MQLLKATVKESFRLNNIGSMNARQLKQDLVLDDYLIPKDVIF